MAKVERETFAAGYEKGHGLLKMTIFHGAIGPGRLNSSLGSILLNQKVKSLKVTFARGWGYLADIPEDSVTFYPFKIEFRREREIVGDKKPSIVSTFDFLPKGGNQADWEGQESRLFGDFAFYSRMVQPCCSDFFQALSFAAKSPTDPTDFVTDITPNEVKITMSDGTCIEPFQLDQGVGKGWRRCMHLLHRPLPNRKEGF
jgi:hypothetical protein